MSQRPTAYLHHPLKAFLSSAYLEKKQEPCSKQTVQARHSSFKHLTQVVPSSKVQHYDTHTPALIMHSHSSLYDCQHLELIGLVLSALVACLSQARHSIVQDYLALKQQPFALPLCERHHCRCSAHLLIYPASACPSTLAVSW